MHANSPVIDSSQAAAHGRLREIVRRHLAQPFRRTPSAAGQRAFATVAERLARDAFVLDAGCGTAMGTFALAAAEPGRLVLGIDKSAAHLAIGARRADAGGSPANAVLLHCELVDFWQLAAAAGLRCASQYLLYPNPWPKPEHVMRRWHAHPVLPSLLAIGGTIELRTNWGIYAEEFADALRLAGRSVSIETFVAEPAMTAFERKYAASGHRLWRCRAYSPET